MLSIAVLNDEFLDIILADVNDCEDVGETSHFFCAKRVDGVFTAPLLGV